MNRDGASGNRPAAGTGAVSVPIERWSLNGRNRRVDAFLARPAFDAQAEEAARAVLSDVRAHGDAAVARYAERFDRVALRPAGFRVRADELRAASAQVDPAFRRAVRETLRRVRAFARAGMRRDWHMATPRGGRVGERFAALDRVGVYIPAGEAPLASTVLMTVCLARVAGVREIVACTPARGTVRVNPFVLHALSAAGATEIYRVGGAQAIGMMAYGTRTVRKVQKIVGPGNAYVTAAKRQVYGEVALDLVAGPSEIAVLADAGASARLVAADLLSQAEHGTGGEKALLVTPSLRLARAVRREIGRQAAALSRREAVAGVLKRGMLIAVAPSLAEGMELCNRFAPEHLELMVRQPRRWLGAVRHAGAVFLGRWTPESAGDFVAGPSHVLPTGGAARMFAGLTVDDFRRRTSFVEFRRADLRETLDTIATFGRVEGLDGHAASARIRFAAGGGR